MSEESAAAPVMLQAFDVVPEALVIVDHEGLVRHLNRRAQSLFGLAEAEVIGQPLGRLVPPNLQGRYAPLATGVDGVQQCETAVETNIIAVRGDGTEFHAEIRFQPLVSEGRRYAIASIRDITERRRVELIYHGLLEAALDAIVVVDRVGAITLVNTAAEQLFGRTRATLVGEPIACLIPQRFAAAHPAKREGFFRSPLPRPMAPGLDLLAIKKDGTEFPVEISLSPIQGEDGPLVIAAIRDVTERKEAEQRLRDSEQRLSTTLDSIGDAVIATDLEGRIVRMNPVAEEMTGWPLAEAQAEPLDRVVRLIDPTSGEWLPSPVERVLSGVSPISSHPGILVAREGAEHFVADRSAPIRSPGGAIEGVVIVLRDLTERRRLEQRVELSERMASLGRLASAVAHEINNPLTYVVANLGFLAEELATLTRGEASTALEQGTELIDALEEARHGAERVRRVVRDLRAFTHSDRRQFTEVDVRSVLEMARKLAWNEVRHRAHLIEDYGDTPPVIADATRLGQVFVNLLVNAAQSFETNDLDANEIRMRSRLDADGSVVVSVQDNGSGIPAALVQRIFQPFVTTQPPGAGTGLGLAICQSIIDGFDGELSVESTLGEGSTFSVSLPVAGADLGAVRPTPSQVPPTGRRGVLIIDSDHDAAAATCRTLVRRYRVEVYDTGVDALARLREDADFDVIICDGAIQQVTAERLHAAVAEIVPHLQSKMIFTAGDSPAPEVQAFLQSVPNPRVRKPIDDSELFAAIEAVLD